MFNLSVHIKFKQLRLKPGKRTLRRVLFGLGLMLIVYTGLFAQIPAHYGQYVFNGLAINPAYCGSRDALATNLLFRGQWLGVPGAPRTLTASVHAPIGDSPNNFGGMVIDDRLGVSQQQWVMGSYAYRLRLGLLGKARLAMGLQGGLSLHKFSYDELYLEDPIDQQFTGTTPTIPVPRFGFGAYFDLPNFFAGVSVPELLKFRTQTYKQYVGDAVDYPHAFLAMGGMLKPRPDMKFKPSVLLKYKPTIPLQADLNANMLFQDRFGVGVSYRTQDALVGMIEFYPVSQLRIGYAYEYGLNALRPWNRGTHEFLLGYEFKYNVNAGAGRNF